MGLLIGGALAGGAGWEWWRLNRQPSMEVLQGNLALLDDQQGAEAADGRQFLYDTEKIHRTRLLHEQAGSD
jgi:hypothetical protein